MIFIIKIVGLIFDDLKLYNLITINLMMTSSKITNYNGSSLALSLELAHCSGDPVEFPLSHRFDSKRIFAP